MTVSTVPSSGNDFLLGTAGNDNIRAGDGNDIIFAGDGNDVVRGDNGDDQISGGNGNDLLIGGRGDDTMLGGEGADRLYGQKGNNFLDGGAGDDYINSGDQSSTLVGGEGNDTLELRLAKGGDHVATGGVGADEFRFNHLTTRAQSDVTITDFELGIDSFTILGQDGAEYVQLLSAGANDIVSEVGGNAVVTLFTGDTITFEGISETAFEDFFGI